MAVKTPIPLGTETLNFDYKTVSGLVPNLTFSNGSSEATWLSWGAMTSRLSVTSIDQFTGIDGITFSNQPKLLATNEFGIDKVDDESYYIIRLVNPTSRTHGDTTDGLTYEAWQFHPTENVMITGIANTKPTTGNDTLVGTAKNDTLNGGLGFDELTGGKGTDKFVFSDIKDAPLSHSKIEVITDFSHSEKDKIDLSAIDANTSIAKDQAFSVPVIGSEFSGIFTKAGQLFFDTTDHILYGNVNADATADFSIQLNGVTNLVAADFIL